jgi:hypothetical protein
MDVLVVLEETSEHSTVLAHVNSVPSPLNSEKPTRDVVTLYGEATPESLAMALAAAMESRREESERLDVIRHLGLWPEQGAVGDAAWRDDAGQLVTRDLSIPTDIIQGTANQLLDECGMALRRLVAGLSMPDWPEGTRRAISFTLTTRSLHPATAGGTRGDSLLEMYRQSDGFTYDNEGD